MLALYSPEGNEVPVAGLRVALLSYRSQPHCGGQGVYVRHLSRELVRLGHHVEVFSGPPYPRLDPGVALTEVASLDLYRDDDPFRTPHLRELRTRIDLLELATMWTAGFPEPLTFSLRVARLLAARAGDFDVVHDNQCLGYGMVRLQKTGLPLVATIHHPITVDRRHDLAAAPLWKRPTVFRWYGFVRMQKRVARRMEHVITVSESSARDIPTELGVAPQRLTVIPVGVDTATFRPDAAPERVPGRIVAMASADVALKGQATLLRAVAALLRERECHLVLIGKPKPGGATEKLVADLGLATAVRFVSDLTDAEVAGYLASAEVAVVPSLYEGFSLPAIEMLACGTALVASAGGALPEVVGDCARLVPPGDHLAMAAAVGELLADPAARQAVGRAGRDRVRERFAWGPVARATAEVYHRAVAESRGC
jgi:glycosyltransferase involved in cell wall biosynthesis